MNYQENIGKTIMKLRCCKGISQERMAFEANIDRRYLSDIENGKRNVSLDILLRIAKFFEMPLSNFLKRVEETTQYDDSNDSLKEWLTNKGFKDAILLDGPSYRNAVIGVSVDGRVIYSERIILENMVFDEGMSRKEAIQYLNSNLLQFMSSKGKNAPIVLTDIS